MGNNNIKDVSSNKQSLSYGKLDVYHKRANEEDLSTNSELARLQCIANLSAIRR